MRSTADTTVTFSHPDTVSDILRGSEFGIVDFQAHFAKIEQASGEDFTPLRQLIEHSLLFHNGKKHLQKRRLVAGALSDAAVKAWAPMILAKTQAHLDALDGQDDVDLTTDVIDPLFCDVICDLIGFEPHPDGPQAMMRMVHSVGRIVERLFSLRKLRAANAFVRDPKLFQTYATVPASSGAVALTAHLSAALGGQKDAEIAIRYISLGVLMAAHTAAAGLSFASWGLLMRGGAQWRDAAAPDWPKRALEQTLNAYLSSRTLGRVALADTEIGGCPMHADQNIVLNLSQANTTLRRDWLGQDFDHSKRGPSLSFGAGQHKCPGEAFARAFISIVLPALSARFPDMVLHRDRVKFQVTDLMHAPQSLPVTLRPKTQKAAAKLWDVKDYDTARAIITDDACFGPPQMAPHLNALQERSGKDLRPVIHIAQNAMFFMSGPRHAALRRSVADVLGQNRLRHWQPLIDARIEDACDRLLAAPTPDLITDFANPIFREITKPILGLHPHDLDRFDHLAPILQDVLEPLLPLRQILKLQTSFAELLELIDPENGSDLGAPLSLRRTLHDSPPKGVSPSDISALALVLYGASFNLSHTLGNALHWCLSLPIEQRIKLHDSTWVTQNLETILATCASPKYIYRHARNDIETQGCEMKASDTIRVHLNAVNRDKSTGQLAFGHGLHHCVGASLSRMLLKRAIPALFSRFPDLCLMSQGHEYFVMSQTVAMKSLPCVLGQPVNG